MHVGVGVEQAYELHGPGHVQFEQCGGFACIIETYDDDLVL